MPFIATPYWTEDLGRVIRGQRQKALQHFRQSNNADGVRQNLMKGYIARQPGIMVLSKTGAFPGTGV